MQYKTKSNNCTELVTGNTADKRGKECVSTRGGLAGAFEVDIFEKRRSNNELQEVSVFPFEQNLRAQTINTLSKINYKMVKIYSSVPAGLAIAKIIRYNSFHTSYVVLC